MLTARSLEVAGPLNEWHLSPNPIPEAEGLAFPKGGQSLADEKPVQNMASTNIHFEREMHKGLSHSPRTSYPLLPCKIDFDGPPSHPMYLQNKIFWYHLFSSPAQI